MRLTKTSVEKLPLPDSGQRIVWDDTLKGFGVRLTPGSRSYVVESRVNGRTRRVTLGAHGVLTADMARKRAQKALVSMTEGKDPNREKKAARARSVTLRECMDDYIRDHADLKASSVAGIRKHIEGNRAPRHKNVRPAINLSAWADLPVASITRDDVQKQYRKMKARSPAQANQAFRVLRSLLNYARAAYRSADDKPILPAENPVSVLSDAGSWAYVPARRRRIAPEKIGTAWALLESLREDPAQTTSSRTGADICAFLLLTGARWSEAAQLTWDRVNVAEGWWFLPDPKNRNSVTLPLNAAARAVLMGRVENGSEYVFPGRSGEGHVKEARRTFERLAEVAGNPVSPHDLRRSFRAVADKCGIELWKTKLLMNQVTKTDVTIKHYTETGDLREFAAEAERISTWILTEAHRTAESNVVRLRA